MESLDVIYNQSFLTTVFSFLMGFFTFVLKVLFFPLNLLIEATLPQLNDVFNVVTAAFNYSTIYVNWLIDAIMIPPLAYDFVIIYYGFILLIGMAAFAIKVAIMWLLKVLVLKLW